MSDIRGQTTDFLVIDEMQSFGDKDFEISAWSYAPSEDELEEGGVFFRRVENSVTQERRATYFNRVLSDTEKSVLWNSGNGLSMNALRSGQ